MPDAPLTPLAAMVVALLHEGDLHPYEMMRLLRHRRDDRMVRITNGTFYHTVSRLERDGHIAEIGVDREGNRPERTTYTLTPHGADTLTRWVRARLPRIDRSADFRVALSEAHVLDRAEALTLLTRRSEALAAERDELGLPLQDARSRNVPEQYLIEADRHMALLTAEIEWMKQLLRRIENPEFAWGDPPVAPTDRIDTPQDEKGTT